MNTITADLGEDKQVARIIPISDVHIGDPHSELDRFAQVIQTIKDDPDCYTIINGDLCNIALKSAVSDVYDEEMSPMQQVQKAVAYLEPIKDKILVMSPGNHEDRIKKETSLDASYFIASELGILERYSPTWWYLFLKMAYEHHGGARVVYGITGYHGSGSGRTIGGKANKLVQMNQIVVADIYLQSHHHTPIATKGVIYEPTSKYQIRQRQQYYLMTNSFVGYDGSYAERMGLVPSNTGITMMELCGTQKSVKLTV